MHLSANEAGRCFFQIYATPEHGRVLDVGSMNVNGSLRPHTPRHIEYVGMDIAAGDGVDIVVPPGQPFPFPDAHFDLIVSTSCFEHDECFWFTFMEIIRCLKNDGFFYLNAPSNGPYHGYPADSWRFYPDAATSLASWARRCGQDVVVVESGTLAQIPGHGEWNDFVAIFQKGGNEVRTSKRLLDSFPNATNIRYNGSLEFKNAKDQTEDYLRAQQLAETLHVTMSELAKLKTAFADLLADRQAAQVIIEHKNRELGQRDRDLEYKAHIIEQRDRDLNALLSSTSWRITAPLRWLGKKLRIP